jgi:N-acetylglutamate synthase-like GNAT family acetyltransferase
VRGCDHFYLRGIDELAIDNLLIRKLKAEDAADICEIHGFITQSPVNPDFKRILEAQARSDEGANFVAELDGRVVGYMVCYFLSGGFGIEKSAWIAMLGVNPNYMGQGIGASLANEIFKVARTAGINTVYTSVEWDSPDLLSFFKTLGFDRSNFINLRKDLV